MDPAIILFGLGVGVLVGTTGMGGGSLGSVPGAGVMRHRERLEPTSS